MSLFLQAKLALAAESKLEKTFLTNLAFSWNRLANCKMIATSSFLKKPPERKGKLGRLSLAASFISSGCRLLAPRGPEHVA